MLRQPWPDTGAAARADLAACRATLRAGSRSFLVASLLLPRGVRDSACAVYAFCRTADDAVDLGGSTVGTVAQLRERLDAVYAGRPRPVPADRALAGVVERHAVPRALLDALLEGFEWDALGRRYDDLADLYAYAARVAGSVGAMMAVLMGVHAPEVLARACDLGVAMQLSNIARDVGEDASAGRLYLPLRWLRDAGVEPDAWLASPCFSDGIGSVVRRLLGAADALYARADAGIARLPPTCRPGIAVARLLYAEIGREVERAGLNSISCRASVPLRRRAGLVVRGLAGAGVNVSLGSAPPLEETRFLVEAAASAVPAHPHLPRPSRRSLETQAAWLARLIEQLHHRERSLATSVAVPRR